MIELSLPGRLSPDMQDPDFEKKLHKSILDVRYGEWQEGFRQNWEPSYGEKAVDRAYEINRGTPQRRYND